jgi:hypothetical protein
VNACEVSMGPFIGRKQHSVGAVVVRGWPFEWECTVCGGNRPQQLVSTGPQVWAVLECRVCKPGGGAA